jgi:hypothetical protein
VGVGVGVYVDVAVAVYVDVDVVELGVGTAAETTGGVSFSTAAKTTETEFFIIFHNLSVGELFLSTFSSIFGFLKTT